MPVNPEIRDSAYQFFIEEVPELLEVIESGLLTLKQERNNAKVHELMRSAHSLKGGAASVELDAIKTIAHRLEDTFKALYNETVEIDAELENLLLQAYDALAVPLNAQLNTGTHDDTAALEKAELVFGTIEAKLGDALTEAENYLPSSEDLGVDIVASMFEVDVTEELERLAAVIANPQESEVAGELRAQLDIFAGFSDILNLPGLGEIAHTAFTALEKNPDQALEITKLVLADFQAAKADVLGGDRAVGGKPSEALIALTQGHPAPATTADLDDVFGEVAQTATPSSESLAEVLGESDDLDDVFGERVDPTPQSEELPAAPPSLDFALESLMANFEDLPASDPLPPAPAPSKTTTTKAKKKSATSQPSGSNLSVRVGLERLERMNNLVGELTINRNGLSLQNEQLQRSLRELLYRFTNFQSLASTLQTLSDVLLVAPQKAPSSSPQPNLESLGDTEFDTLEMDRYNQLHTLLQGILEEILQLEEKVDDITLFSEQSNKTIDQQRSVLNHLRDELMWSRMLPVGDVLKRFPRNIHNLSRKFHKPVNLQLSGTGVLVDKAVLEKLYDPLLHLLRNAFDHGIESSQIRRQRQKPEMGQIQIRAYHSGNHTVIEVRDDGQGINLARVRQKAITKGIISKEQAKRLNESQLYELIFEPGFSTTDQVSEISGRGVGLDSVRTGLRQLKGTVSVTSTPGKGTSFTLRLPLTLTIAKLLVCLEGTSAVALPSDSVEEIIVPNPQQIKKSGQQRFFDWQGKLIPIYRTQQLLEYQCPLPETIPGKALASIPTPKEWALPLLILQRESQSFALEVERVITEQELVIKPFGKALAAPSYSYGCTILGDGSLVPVIDGLSLIEYGIGTPTSPTQAPVKVAKPAPKAKTVPTILVVDDSTALRRTLALSLQKAGYKVLQAKDGQEALEKLQQSTTHLVICDLEMPTMNGFEFLNRHRQDPKLSKIPVVMLTSRGNEKHRKLATHLGATAYFSKPYIEPEFLPALKEILQTRYTKRKAAAH